MNTCQEIKKQLLEVGLNAVRKDPQLSNHIQSCAECTALLKAYAEVPALLDQLPEHEPSDALLASTLDAVKGSSSAKPTSPRWNRPFAAAMGSVVVLLAVFGLSLQIWVQQSSISRYSDGPVWEPLGSTAPQAEAARKAELRQAEDEAQSKDRFVNQESTNGDVLNSVSDFMVDGKGQGSAQGDHDIADADGFSFAENKRTSGGQPAPAMVGGLAGSDTERNLESPARGPETLNRDLQTQRGYEKSVREMDVGAATMDPDSHAAAVAELSRLRGVYSDGHPDVTRLEAQIAGMQSLSSPDDPRLSREGAIDAEVAALSTDQRGESRRSIESEPDVTGVARYSGDYSRASDAEFYKQLRAYELEQKNNVAVAARGSKSATLEEIVVVAAKNPVGPAVDDSNADIQEIIVTGNRIVDFSVYDFDFLEHYQQTSGLSFQSPEGYWANSYVPGDPQIRLLSARLARWDRTALGESWRLEQDVTPVRQPFDAPENNALALTLMSDANAVDGPTRMRLQVGVRGIEHLRGQRPAMNLAVVIDLPDDAGDADRIATRALLDALLSSKQSGDRFSLVMGGGLESLTIAPEDFRFGPLQLATQAILGQQPSPTGERGSLLDAVQSAAKLVKSGDDPSRPLGSSAILLISAGGLAETDALAAFAHSQARDGITFSVFPLGDRPQSADVELLVLAGLGNRRYLESPDRARALVEEELHAASRAVARAARLAIRLAPGVHLVEVIGSHRLELPDQERVKEIETAMDQRLRTNLGIEADRGDDEDGIQIIIPSVFADDSLTVLVDVVVDKAGPIADVSLRYKDLVFKKNGTLSSHFELGDGPLNRGPSELAVLKNLLAHYFSESVQDAAEALAQDDFELAESELATALTTLTGLKGEINAWEDDPELLRDQLILARYLSVLTSPEGITHQPILADSLRYAAWAKTHQPAE